MEFIKVKKLKDRKKMNWAEAKWANPGLRPNKDWDNDGIKNQFDCRPMNRKMQHEDQREHQSKWKTRVLREFGTVGDLKEYAKEKGFNE